MLIFYLSVSYLQTKRLTEQYKSFSQVIVSFTKMSCYNAYRCSTAVENGKRCRRKPWTPNFNINIYMMSLTQVKQYVLILAKAIQENLQKMLVNNV